MKKVLIGMIAGVLLNGCTMLDDYMLGKDNTPKPARLAKIDDSVQIRKNWMENVSPRAKQPTELYKLYPVIQGKVIYTASASGFVQARLKENGKLLWSKDLDVSLASGPNVSGKVLVVGGADATVSALSTKSGESLWLSSVSNQLLAPPVISGRRVFAKTIDGQLYAFDVNSGKKIWRYTHGAPNLILRASSEPVVADNMVISGFSDGKIDALDVETGRLVWQRVVSFAKGSSDVERLADIDATPIIKGQKLYVVNYQGDVLALSLQDGRVLWRHKMSAYRDMAISGNALYVVDADSVVWAINRHNGMVLWSQRSMKHRGLNAPATSSLGVTLTDNLGYLHVLSKSTGEEIGRSQLTSTEIDTMPVVQGQLVYVLFENGSLANYLLTKS